MANTEKQIELAHITSTVINELSQQSFLEVLEYLQRSGISLPRYSVLRVLEREPGVTISMLAQQLNLTLGSASQLVDRLESDLLISRQEDQHDRRVRRIYLESKGLEILAHATKLANQAIIDTFAKAPIALQNEFATILTKLLPYITKESR